MSPGKGHRSSNNHGNSAFSFNSTKQVMASSLRVDESGLGFGLPIGFGQGVGAGAGDWMQRTPSTSPLYP